MPLASVSSFPISFPMRRLCVGPLTCSVAIHKAELILIFICASDGFLGGKKMYFYCLVICVHVCLWLHEHKCRCPWRPEGGRFSKVEFKVAVRLLTWYWEHGPSTERCMFPTAEPSLQPELILLAAYEFSKSNFFWILRELFPFLFKCFSNFVFIS